MDSRGENPALLSWLGALNDLARLRVLRLIAEQELSVGEVAKALQLPQSTVSRHLKLLLESGWIAKRSEGTASLYRMAAEALDPGALELWQVARNQLGSSPTFQDDDHRLAGVLAERRTDSRAFFGRIGGEWDHLRRQLFGEAFTNEALLGLLGDDLVVADLGCGTGEASERLAPFVKKIIAIDREPAMLDAARKRLADFGNIEFRQGDLAALPLRAGEVDAAMAFLVLVHLREPEKAVFEVSRTLKDGDGRLLIVDLVAHDRQSFRHTMGHEHLGFHEKQVRKWAKAADLADVRYRRLRPDTDSKGPGLFMATMRKR
jgi:ArsR family transcriptional regulator